MPRPLLALALAATLLLLSSAASAVELRYRWSKGATHRYRAQATQRVDMAAHGMKLGATVKSDTTFALKIVRPHPDGSADALVSIERFVVKDARGRTVATVKSLPASALTVPVSIDAYGRYSHPYRLMLLVPQQGPTLLAKVRAGKGGASASASAGGVQVWARFDRKTGALSGGVRSLKRRPKTQRVGQDAQRVDIVPHEFLDLLLLPKGPVNKGDVIKVQIADYDFTTTVNKATAKAAELRLQVATQAGRMAAGGAPAKVQAKRGGAKVAVPGMPGGMPGMPGGMPGGVPGVPGVPGGAMAGVPGMHGGGGGPAGGPAMPTMTMKADLTLTFAPKAGRLTRVGGWVSTSSRVPGMAGMPETRIDSRTDLTLTPVK